MTDSAGMIGRTYLLRGEPVVVVARWRDPGAGDCRVFRCTVCGHLTETPDRCVAWRGDEAICLHCGRACDYVAMGGAAVRNVLLRRADGTLTVRPFRGLRRPG